MNPISNPSQVLRTKLYRPLTPDILVERPHLLKRLDVARNRPLTLVSAAAGYGKTTWSAVGSTNLTSPVPGYLWTNETTI